MARILWFVILSQIASNGWLVYHYDFFSKSMANFICAILATFATAYLIIALIAWVILHWDDGCLIRDCPTPTIPKR